MADLTTNPNVGIRALNLDPAPDAGAQGVINIAIGDAAEAPTVPGGQQNAATEIAGGRNAGRTSFWEKIHNAIEKLADKIDSGLEKIGTKLNNIGQKVSDYFEAKREARALKNEIKRLDRRDEAVAGDVRDKSFSTKPMFRADMVSRGTAKLSVTLSHLIKEAKAEAKAEGKPYEDVVSEKVDKFVAEMSTKEVGKVQTERLDAAIQMFNNEGRTEKASLLQELNEAFKGAQSRTSKLETVVAALQDAEDLPAADKTATLEKAKSNINGWTEGDPKQFSANVGKLVSDLKAKEGDFAANVKQYFAEMMLEVTAFATLSLDLDLLDAYTEVFSSKGENDKAMVTSALASALRDIQGTDTVENASKTVKKTTDGGETVETKVTLRTQAQQAMKDVTNPRTFLRQTSNEGTAAVKKLMNAAGAGDVEADIYNIAFQRETNEETRALEQSIMQSVLGGAITSKTEGITREQADELIKIGKSIMDDISKVTIPDEMKAELKTLADAIQQRVTDDEISQEMANELIEKLYVDQAFLKIVSPPFSKTGNINKVAVDLVQMIANGGMELGSKITSAPLLEALEAAKPDLSAKINAFLTEKFGMPRA